MGKRNNDKWGVYDPRAPYNVSSISYWAPDRKRWYRDGSYSPAPSEVETRHSSVRPRYTKQPIEQVPGTTSKGRKPTAYTRRVYSQVTVQETKAFGIRKSTGLVTRELVTSLNTTFLNNAAKTQKLGVFIANGVDPYGNVDFANERDRSVTECLLKLQDNKVDLGVALAELRKTSTHLAKSATDLWRALGFLRNKKWGRLGNILSKRAPGFRGKVNPGMTSARYWLEYNYAWKPLIMEVGGLMELVKLQLEPALLVHATRTVHNRGTFVVSDLDYPAGYNWSTPGFTVRAGYKRASTTRLTGRISSAHLRYASQGFTNPVNVAWELMPYSFVIDWSLPVGNYLSALTATHGLTFTWGSTVMRYFCNGYADLKLPRDDTLYHYEGTNGTTEIFKFGMDRQVYSSFPRPVLYAKNPFSTSHAISALALLRGLF